MKVRRKNQGQPGATSPHLTPESPKRGLMSGETLRASRQQLRLLCGSDFHFVYLAFTPTFLVHFTNNRHSRRIP